jgi:uncharacterized protein
MKAFEQVFDFVKEIPIIDSHEHLCEEEKVGPDPDIINTYLFHYLTVDIVSSGLSWEDLAFARDAKYPVKDRFQRIAKYWERARLTGYAQSLDLSVQKLYDEERIDINTIESLSGKFKAANKPGHYQHVLRDLCNIEISVNDMINDMKMTDSPLFKFVGRIDPMIEPRSQMDLGALSAKTGVRLHNLDDYEELCEKYLDGIIKQGQIGLKCGLAYRRTLDFEKVPRKLAEEAFNKLLLANNCAGLDLKPFQDYMMHRVCAFAEKRQMFMQVHTGILEGNGNHIPNSDPMKLDNLIQEYSKLRFDLFHIGYPYHDQVGAMVKMFPNAFVDLAWANIISPPVTRRVLSDWLETIPANKITGFGGDYGFVDGVYGHQLIARRNVSAALAQKMDEGLIGLSQAKKLAQMIFHDNPKEIFGL